MVKNDPDGTGAAVLEKLAAIGYDYIELSLAHIMKLDDAAFSDLKSRIVKSPVKCEACHNFFPAAIRLTGPDADRHKVVDYVTMALERASALGAKIVVFGSAGAKNVPDGFPVKKAWQQLIDLLKVIDSIAKKYDIIIAIEPINKFESNIINSAKEGLELIRQVNKDNIQLLVDYYHIAISNEPFDVICEAAGHIKHVHFAEVLERQYPKVIKDSYIDFFRHLKDCHYDGRISIEAFSSDFENDAVTSLHLLKNIFGKLG